MQRSYIDYAMSVIVGRALPLVEDGLKPVHRRVLYSMGENGFRPDRSFVKCARVVGEVMGNYHPHGDSTIAPNRSTSSTRCSGSFIDYAMSVHRLPGAAATSGTGSSRCTAGCCTAMYDSGFRPDRSYGQVRPACRRRDGQLPPARRLARSTTPLVRLAQPWSLRYPLIDGQGNFGSPGNDPPAAMRYTECRLTPLAMAMLPDIDEDTVDFIGRTTTARRRSRTSCRRGSRTC